MATRIVPIGVRAPRGWLCISPDRKCGVYQDPELDRPTKAHRTVDVTEKKLRAHLSRVYEGVPPAAWQFGAWTTEGCEAGTVTAELTITAALEAL